LCVGTNRGVASAKAKSLTHQSAAKLLPARLGCKCRRDARPLSASFAIGQPITSAVSANIPHENPTDEEPESIRAGIEKREVTELDPSLPKFVGCAELRRRISTISVTTASGN
jgi:hypothetical protein